MEEKTQLNFSIPTELSLKIDKLHIDLLESGSMRKKDKATLLIDLLYLGYNVKSKNDEK